MVPIVEPSNQQEAYNCMHFAFDLSEELQLPVLVRMVTRLSHSRAAVNFKERRAQNGMQLPVDTNRFALIPAFARKRYEQLIQKKARLLESSNRSNFNRLKLTDNKKLGIITGGIAYNYVLENLSDDEMLPSILKIGQYPLPKEKIVELYDHCEKILVVEEGYPLIEEILHNYFEDEPKIIGKLTGHLPLTGELTPDLVGRALGKTLPIPEKMPDLVKPRPPQLCEGCGHTDLFNVINELIPEIGNKQVFGDIGCYALGVLPPLQTLNTLIDMGASITMAKGAADAGLKNVIAVIGDSTFTHSGMTGLLDAVYENSPITVVISDNSAVAMTGGQDSTAVGRLKKICLGLGVHPEHVKEIVPLHKNHDSNVEVLRKELNYPGVSVIISERACVRLSRDKKVEIKEKIASFKTN